MGTIRTTLVFLFVLLLIIEKVESQGYNTPVPKPVLHSILHKESSGDEYYDDDASYSFRYDVEDPYAGNYFGHHEERDGDYTAGAYHVLLPDGRRQKVSYTVNGDSGFVAQIEYEGVANFYSQTVNHETSFHSQSFSPSSGDSIHTELLPAPQAHIFSDGFRNIGVQQTRNAGVFTETGGLNAGPVSNINDFTNAEIVSVSSQHVAEAASDGGIVSTGISSTAFDGIHAGSQIGSDTGTFATDGLSTQISSGGTAFSGGIAGSTINTGHFGSSGSPLAVGHNDGFKQGQADIHGNSLSFGSLDSTGTTFGIRNHGTPVELNVGHSGSEGNFGVTSHTPAVAVIPVGEIGSVGNAFAHSHDLQRGTGFDAGSIEGFTPVFTENEGQGFVFTQALTEGSGFEVGHSGQLGNVVGSSDFGVQTDGLPTTILGGSAGPVDGILDQFRITGANHLGTSHSNFNSIPIHNTGTFLSGGVSTGRGIDFQVGQVDRLASDELIHGGASFGVGPSSVISVAEGISSINSGISQAGLTSASLGNIGVNIGIGSSDNLAIAKGSGARNFGANIVGGTPTTPHSSHIVGSSFGIGFPDGQQFVGGSRGSDFVTDQVGGVTTLAPFSNGGVISEVGLSHGTGSNLGFTEGQGSVGSVVIGNNHINHGNNVGVGNLASNPGVSSSSSFPSVDVNAFTVAPEPVKATDNIHTVQEGLAGQPGFTDADRSVFHSEKASAGHLNQALSSDLHIPHLQTISGHSATANSFEAGLSSGNLQQQSSHSTFNDNHIPHGALAVEAPTIIVATLRGDDISNPHTAILRKLVDATLAEKAGTNRGHNIEQSV
ncbi:putative per-hexamer repeat protein 5 [Palaemon carinicauda]|uniref:putative per-hexamer repeat protein 5 n=1 Tax=Palaemon carinicauda TaxID=392227 RepID=UPI0035B59B90